MCYSWFPDLGHHLRSRLPIWYLCERWRSLFWIHIAPESSPCSNSFASEGVLLSAAPFEAQMFTAIWDLDHGSRSGGHNTPEARGSGLNFTVNGRKGNSRTSYIQDTLMYKKKGIFHAVEALGWECVRTFRFGNRGPLWSRGRPAVICTWNCLKVIQTAGLKTVCVCVCACVWVCVCARSFTYYILFLLSNWGLFES